MPTHHLQASVVLALAIGVASTAAAPALAQGLPQHMVAYMSEAGQTQCPDNWTEAAYAQGRVILGTTDGSKIQKVAGTPASPGQSPQHVHAFKVTTTVGSEERRLNPFPSGDWRAGGGQLTSTGTTDATPTALPFIQFLVCEHMAAESSDEAPYGTVAFFNAQACPENWAALNQADGRFILPAYPDSVLGSDTGITWDPTDPPGHTHGLSASFETNTAEYLHKEGPHSEFATPGYYTLSGTSASAGPMLPFVSLLVCQKNELGHSEGIPLGILAFFGSEDCPDDWGTTIGADGRFIIGIGGEAKPGVPLGGKSISSPETSIQHVHTFSGEAGYPDITGGETKASGGTEAAFVTGASNHYSGTSDHAVQQLPYLVLTACTYTAGKKDWQGAGQAGAQ